MKKHLILLALVTIFSCQNKESKVIQVNETDTVVSKKEENAKEVKSVSDDTIHLNFIDEKGLFTVEGELDSIHPRAYLKFENDDLGKLEAKIIPTTGKGNIRFNQIIFPDNTSDGPFGMSVDLDLNQKGKNVLVIGHSQMADYPFWGKFKVELKINKK